MKIMFFYRFGFLAEIEVPDLHRKVRGVELFKKLRLAPLTASGGPSYGQNIEKVDEH